VISNPPSTTAYNEQSWLPSPSVPSGFAPTPVFNQDFELLPPTPVQSAPAQVPSHASTLHPSSKTAYRPNSTQAFSDKRSSYQRNSTRPPVPLFQSNSTGNIPASQNQQTVNLSDITMGGSGTSASPSANMSSPSLTSHSANVAYHDTMGDLGAFENGASFGDFNMFTDLSALSAANTNPLTVSPKDLFNGGDSMPPSTSFTNLTTPGSTYLETPESYSASPLFNDTLDNTFDFSSHCDSSNFFPELESLVPAPSMERTVSNSSNNPIIVHPGGPAHSRKRSSTTASPAVFARPSSVAGVGAKKRDKPLPPIMVDEHDTVALKRARNTAAARKSRAKKVEERDVLESRISELEGLLATQARETEYWKAKAQGVAMDDLSD
jgi:hypothetical protein